MQSYVRTYVERDVRSLASVQDQQQFSRLLSLCAALTAREVNHSQFGREIGVTPQTASRWLNILKATYQWLELPPLPRQYNQTDQRQTQRISDRHRVSLFPPENFLARGTLWPIPC